MATFCATTASNGPRLKDVDAILTILDQYVWDGDVEARISEQGEGNSCLVIYGYDWPRAWKIPEDVDPSDFEPDYDADDGFEEFLKEVAPYLDEPLTVHAIGAEKCRFPLAACEWHILPGASNVEINSFHHFDEEVHA